MKKVMVYTPTYVQDPDTGEDIEIHTCDKEKLSELYDRLPDDSMDKETLMSYSISLGSNGDPPCHIPTTYGFVWKKNEEIPYSLDLITEDVE